MNGSAVPFFDLVTACAAELGLEIVDRTYNAPFDDWMFVLKHPATKYQESVSFGGTLARMASREQARESVRGMVISELLAFVARAHAGYEMPYGEQTSEES